MSGYIPCSCRDCMEVTVGDPGEYCDDCEKAGCPDYQGVIGMSQECQRPDAGPPPPCPLCKNDDEVYFDGHWCCARCEKPGAIKEQPRAVQELIEDAAEAQDLYGDDELDTRT